jgi:hypothetical protein
LNEHAAYRPPKSLRNDLNTRPGISGGLWCTRWTPMQSTAKNWQAFGSTIRFDPINMGQ